MEHQARFQDVIGQFPQLKTYNHGLFCFPVKDENSRAEIVETLEAAWDNVTSKIPWLREQVVNEGKKLGDSGYFTTAPWPSDVSAASKSRIYVKDCSDICPSYPELIKAQAPVSMLDGSILCPFPGFPLSYDESIIGPAPVVAIQANFIKGGLLLNFSNQHNMMDATGLFTFIMLLAAAMRGEELPEQIVEAANLDRSTIIPLLSSGEPIKNHDQLRRPAAPPPTTALAQPTTAPQQPRPTYKWAYFRISKSKIARIKTLATPPSPPSSGMPASSTSTDSPKFISTNDALSAYYWQRLSTIRLSLNPNLTPMHRSKFSRAIDTRSVMKTPMGYMGQMVYQSASYLTMGEVTTLPLSTVAARVRADLKEANTEHAVRSYVTFLAGVKDKGELAYAGVFNPAADIGSSSMAGTEVGALSFGGLLGEVGVMRRPRLAPVPGLFYVFPMEGDGVGGQREGKEERETGGGLPVLICLEEGEMEALRGDDGEGGWGEVAEFIG